MNKFAVEFDNSTNAPIRIQAEPAGWWVELESGKTAIFRGEYFKQPITLQISFGSQGKLYASVFPGDGDIQILIDGIDMLEDWLPNKSD